MQGHKEHKGVTSITTGSAKNASCALWFFVDIVTCGYKCRVTKITKEAQRPLREALNKRRAFCGSFVDVVTAAINAGSLRFS